MTRKLRARFDGKVLIPEEPVDLPAGQVVELRIELAPERPSAGGAASDTRFGEAIRAFIEGQPPMDTADMPTDGSINYRHYLYGHPKQPLPEDV